MIWQRDYTVLPKGDFWKDRLYESNILLFFERIARRKASSVLVICIAFLFTLFNNELLMTSICLHFFEVFGVSYGIR